MGTAGTTVHREPWNKGKLVGQKAPFKLKDIWALRVRLQMENRVRELALFNLGIDSKLRGCDLVGLKVRDICHGDQVASRAMVMQHKTQRPVQFEITPATARQCRNGRPRASIRITARPAPRKSRNAGGLRRGEREPAVCPLRWTRAWSSPRQGEAADGNADSAKDGRKC